MLSRICKPTVGVTGGIGSGKSYVCRLIEEAGYSVFYCDPAAKHLIRTDPDLHRELTALVAGGVYTIDGKLDKGRLAAFLCQGREASTQVNRIVHPRVAEAWRQWAREHAEKMAFMECALLFESGFDRLVDKSLLVYAPDNMRLERIMARDGVSQGKARAWMALQLPEEKKARRADFILYNDGRPLLPQIQSLIQQFN